MCMQKLWKLGFRHLKSLALPVVVALLLTGMFSVSTYAAGNPIPASIKPGHIGADLIINGKIIQLTPVTSVKSGTSTSPGATVTCVVPLPGINNVGFTPTYASFDVSTVVFNVCSAATKSGKWNVRGYVTCSGVVYSNPPSASGAIPVIASYATKNVQGPTTYYGVCVNNTDIYAPSDVTINSFVSGTLTDGRIFQDSSSATANIY